MGLTAETDVQQSAENDVQQFLGRSIDDSEFSGYLSENGCFPAMGSWSCPEARTEFALDTGSRVTAVMMRGAGSTSPAYRGALPAGISFDDTPETLAAKLGEPEVISDTSWRWRGEQRHLIVNFSPTPPLRIFVVKVQLAQ